MKGFLSTAWPARSPASGQPPAPRAGPVYDRPEADARRRTGAGQREGDKQADVADRPRLAVLDMQGGEAAEPVVRAVQLPAREEMQPADVAPRGVVRLQRDRGIE